LPGIDTHTGNPLPASSLVNYTTITQNPSGAPYFYNPSNNQVYVTQNGAVLSGINFGSATVTIEANNVTIKDSTFTATSSFWTISQAPGYSGATIEDSTFQGSGAPTEGNMWINATQMITIEDNTFLNSPTDAIDFSGASSQVITSAARDLRQERTPTQSKCSTPPCRRPSPTISSIRHPPPA
jgi:hypothetical protein